MSIQETVVTQLSSHILGYEFLFKPATYRKGKALREPADLAWHHRDSVVLMWMTATGRGWKQDLDHNLRQARGWMKVWKSGQRLCGANDRRTFAVPHSSQLATMILSISADPALQEIVVHDEFAKEVGVDQCATVSQNFLDHLTKRGGGFMDVAEIVSLWKTARSEHPALTDIQLVEIVRSFAMDTAATAVGWRRVQTPSPELLHATEYVRTMRLASVKGSREGTDELNVNSFLPTLDSTSSSRCF